jgi:hypothetical protein
MKLNIISILLCILFTDHFAFAQQSPSHVTINASHGANFRVLPKVGADAKVLGAIPFGVKVHVIGQQTTAKGIWYQVEYGGQTGWMSAKLATNTDSPEGVMPFPAPARPNITDTPVSITSETPQTTAKPATSTGTDVLYIGDSHSVGCFGTTLDNSLRALTPSGAKSPLRVSSYSTCGSSTRSWLKGSNRTSCGFRACGPSQTKCGASSSTKGSAPILSSLLGSEKPRLTVVALGANDLQKNYSLESAKAEVASLIKQIHASGSQCLWVGPPQEGTAFVSLAKYNAFVSALSATVEAEGCKFVDSSKYSDRSKITDPMHIHYGCTAASQWGAAAFKGEISADVSGALSNVGNTDTDNALVR